MRLFIARHAESEPRRPDELRRLTDAGREQARALGERLAPARPNVVLTSPLLRARQTAEAIAAATGAALRSDARLAPGATAEALLEAVDGAGETVVTVGHQPDCGEIAAALTGKPVPRFPPAGVVEVTLP